MALAGTKNAHGSGICGLSVGSRSFAGARAVVGLARFQQGDERNQIRDYRRRAQDGSAGPPGGAGHGREVGPPGGAGR